MKFPYGTRISRGWRWARTNAALVSLALAVLTAGTVGVGVWKEVRKGEADPDGDITVAERVSTVVYQTAQVMLLNMEPKTGSNAYLMVGRVFAVLFVLFLGMQAVRKLLGDSVQNFRLLKWRCWGEHSVVCGLGHIGWPIVRQLRQAGRRVLVIERDPANEMLDEARRTGAVVLVGDATEEEILEQAHFGRARALYVVTGSDDENIEAAIDAYTVRAAAAAPTADFECYVHLLDPALGDVLDSSLAKTAADAGFRTFNVVRNSARRLIIDELTAGRPRTPDEVALYVIVGFGTQGQTMATHLAELAHFENHKRARILILADDPKAAAAAFLSRRGQFSPETVAETWDDVRFDPKADAWTSRDCRPRPAYRVEDAAAVEYACNAVFAACPASMADRGFLGAIQRLVAEPGVKPAVIFCHDTDRENYAAAMTAERNLRVEGNLSGPARVRLFAWLPRQEPLKQVLLRYTADSRGETVHPIPPFGSCNDELNLDGLKNPLEDRLGQEINAGFSGIDTAAPDGPRRARAAWLGLSETDRHSNRMAAVHAEVKLAYLGSRLLPPQSDGRPDPAGADLPAATDADIDALARVEHNRWMAERLLAGTSYGPRGKTPPRRPTLCAWETLMASDALKGEPEKDRVQIRTIFATLQRLGYRTARMRDEG